MYAVIFNGGKQYKVVEGETLQLEKFNGEEGSKVEFSPILVSDENGVKVGADAQNYNVVAEIVSQGKKSKKVIVFKYKAKKNERKKQGHRQPFTAVKIVSISAK